MSYRFDGRGALVTGGTRGIGKAVTVALAQAGARVIAVYREDEESAARLTEDPRWDLTRCQVLRADVTSDPGRRRIAAAVGQLPGGLDVLVNNVGRYHQIPFSDLTPEIVQDMMSANLTSHVLLTRGLLTLLRQGGSVVNVGAGMAQRGRAGHAHFTAAKAGLAGFTRSLAKELGPRGIRVNLVLPGAVDAGHADALPPALHAEIAAAIPLRRLATPADISNVVLFLAGAGAGFVSGALVRVDGGL